MIGSCAKKKLESGTSGVATSKRTAIVSASTNLVMRGKPDRAGKKIGVIPHGETVEILAEGDSEVTIDKVTSKWYKVLYSGAEGWVFGGYLTFATGGSSKDTLSEEIDSKKYIGKEFVQLSPELKSKMSGDSYIAENLALASFKYNGKYVMIVKKEIGRDKKNARWKIADAKSFVVVEKRELAVMPGFCKSSEIKNPIVAIVRDEVTDCKYTRIISAWTIDPSSGHFDPAMTDSITCEKECCDGCE
jgi:hypothetical protein